jgi:hypothetical protein
MTSDVLGQALISEHFFLVSRYAIDVRKLLMFKGVVVLRTSNKSMYERPSSNTVGADDMFVRASSHNDVELSRLLCRGNLGYKTVDAFAKKDRDDIFKGHAMLLDSAACYCCAEQLVSDFRCNTRVRKSVAWNAHRPLIATQTFSSLMQILRRIRISTALYKRGPNFATVEESGVREWPA